MLGFHPSVRTENEFMNPYKPPESIDDTTPFVDRKLTPVVCANCGNGFDGVMKKSLIGFRQYPCQHCRKDMAYPMLMPYRITYWILLVSAFTYQNLAGESWILEIFIFLLVFAVLMDLYLLWKHR